MFGWDPDPDRSVRPKEANDLIPWLDKRHLLIGTGHKKALGATKGGNQGYILEPLNLHSRIFRRLLLRKGRDP